MSVLGDVAEAILDIGTSSGSGRFLFFLAIIAFVALVAIYLIDSQAEHIAGASQSTELFVLPDKLNITGSRGGYDILENAKVLCYTVDRDLYCSPK